ncbi:MAG: pseudouridine synthase [Rhodobacteraceae bacterium]|jgi:23S rRNA pseudouridine2605 synthase|nr:pseudouridine synthase [Paracoccaceae bacterium]
MADKSTPEGERIAKVLSRRGIASRREAERLIEAGEVRVNGRVIDSPALNVTARDRITVSGRPLPDEEPARLWLYYKPEGLVTSAADEKGRDTVFDHLPEDMPRVMSVGRLDLNSEGLLLLTNDGALKRRLELPSTGWLRKYRVRVNGTPDEARLAPLREGITVEGERFLPMQVTLDRVQGANAWLTVGLREGKNREIRRAMSAVGLYVNRLIRVSYGPFRLGELQPGQVEEIRPRVLREQLGGTGEAEEAPVPPSRSRRAAQGADPARRPPRPDTRPDARPDSPPETRRGETGARPPRREAEAGTAKGRALAPGEGKRALSRAWQEATTPRPAKPGDAPAPRRSAGQDAPPARRGRPQTKDDPPRDETRPRRSSAPAAPGGAPGATSAPRRASVPSAATTKAAAGRTGAAKTVPRSAGTTAKAGAGRTATAKTDTARPGGPKAGAGGAAAGAPSRRAGPAGPKAGMAAGSGTGAGSDRAGKPAGKPVGKPATKPGPRGGSGPKRPPRSRG